ncbi:MAG: GTP-binding protein [Clostridia bacterium]|nr:GTP-binding protein [Clostridia bacterium]
MVKVDVISGFLGAGKTTLIKKLFESAFNKEKIVLIENEFGEIGIDGAFLKESGVEIKEINSGCICCSLVGDFSSSMKEVIAKFDPERIIIEPSGVGKLSDIVRAIEKVDADLKVNIVATVVDGGKCKMYRKNFGEFYNDQVKEANTVVISKTEKLSEAKLKEAVDLVKELNQRATIITTPIFELDGNKLLSTLENNVSLVEELLKELAEKPIEEHHHHHHHDGEECSCHHHHHDDDDEDEHEHHHHHDDDDEDEHEHHHHHDDDDDDEDEHEHHHHNHHDADDIFTSWGKETTDEFSHDELDQILKTLCDDESGLGIVLRAKGIVKAKDNEKWYHFDLVAGDYEIRTGAPDYTGRLCVIGSEIDLDKIEKLFLKR